MFFYVILCVYVMSISNLIFSFNYNRFSNNKIQYKNDNQKDFFTIYQSKTEELNEFAIRSAYPSIQLTSKPYKDKKEENINYNEKYQSFSQSREKGEKKFTGFTVKNNNIDGVNILSENYQTKNNFRKDDNNNDNNNDDDDDVIIIIDSDSDVEIQEDNNSNNNNDKSKKISKSNNYQNNLRKKNNKVSPIKNFSSFQNISKNKIENANNNINKNGNENKNETEYEYVDNLFESRIILIEDTPHLLQRLFNTDNTGVKRSSGGGDISDQNNR